jgi:hypothetical protein
MEREREREGGREREREWGGVHRLGKCAFSSIHIQCMEFQKGHISHLQ